MFSFLITMSTATMISANVGVWIASPWTRCSSACSTGIAYRRVECRSRTTNEILAQDQCPEPRPSPSRFCSSLECQWGCTAASKKPICLSASLEQMPEEQCHKWTRPGDFRDDFVCPYGIPEQWQSPTPYTEAYRAPILMSYSWMVKTPWTSCLPRCGSNRYSWRDIACVGSNGVAVDERMCLEPAPIHRQLCPGEVQCSVSEGRCRTKDLDEVADYWCYNQTGLNSWSVVSDWSSCSFPTLSFATRQVECQSPPCNASQTPGNLRSCSWMPPLTYQPIKEITAPLCTAACGAAVVSHSYQCRFQEVDLDDEYCRTAGVPDPLPISCKTQTCSSSKPCDLHARLNISIPFDAFADEEEIRHQLQVDLGAAFPNATSVNISRIRVIGDRKIEAEFLISCVDGRITAGDDMEMQMADPDSPLRHGVITRGSGDRLEVVTTSAIRSVVASTQGSDPVADDQSVNVTTIYIALGMFAVVFLLLRYIVLKAPWRVKILKPRIKLFSVQDLDLIGTDARPQMQHQAQLSGIAGSDLSRAGCNEVDETDK